jgi:hypothetical protein
MSNRLSSVFMGLAVLSVLVVTLDSGLPRPGEFLEVDDQCSWADR